MNKNIASIFFLILILATVFALPSCSITAPTTGDYNNRDNVADFDYSCTDAVDSNATLNGTLIIDGQDLNSLITTDGTYTIIVTAVDVDNNSITTQLSFVFDSTAPTGTITSADYTNDEPELTISASNTTGWKMYLSCENDGPWREYDYTSTITNFDVTDDDYDCDNGLDEGDDEIYVYIMFKDKAGNFSTGTIRTDEMTYDSVDPDFDEADFTITAGDEEVEVTWTDPDDDTKLVSVTATVILDDDEIEELQKTANKESIVINDLENGERYDIELLLVDAAGNSVTLNDFASFTPQGNVATIKITPTTEYVKSADKLTATCTFSKSGTDNAVLSYKYSGPSTDEEDIDEADGTVSGNVTISNTNHSRITFYCTAKDTESTSAYKTIDNNKPIVEWKDTNNFFSGTKRVLFRATDNLELAKVELDFNNLVRTISTKDVNQNYYFDLNSFLYENGSYSLKAIATDGAGNKTEITRTITLDNYVSPKQLAEKAINDAKTKQKTAIDLINYYKEQGLVVPTELNAKNESANSLLAQAMSEINSQPETSKLNATNAAKLFEEFNLSAITQVTETVTYATDLNNSVEILQKYGLSNEDAIKQIATMQSSGIIRKLSIIQTASSANRQIRIEITFTNDTNSDIVKIIEVIPKELINSARNLISDANYRIIKDDPVVEFIVPVAKGASATISYGIGEITTAQAQELMNKNVINLFETSPIVLEGTLTTETTLKNLANGNELLFLIIGLLVILIIIAAIIMFIKFKMPGHGFGKEKSLIEHLKPEQKETKKKFEAFKK